MEEGQQTTTDHNKPLMGVAKLGVDTAVKAKVALAVNWAFRGRVDHVGGGKVGANGRAAVDNIQHNKQLQMMVASSGLGSRGGGSKQRQSAVIGSKVPMAKAIIVAPPTPLLSSSAGGSGRVAVAAARE